MPTQIPTKFMQFVLSDEELAQAKIFSPLNAMYLQNLRSGVAETKLALKVDPNNIKDFVQQEAYLTGKLELLTELIETERG